MRVLLAILMMILAVGARAEERKIYFFGNSLINHLDGGDETAVPTWLARMARAGGHRFGADGQWGFLRDFLKGPQPNWSFRQVQPVWDGRVPFGQVGWDAIVVNPANFIQYQAPEAPYDGDNPDGTSPLSALIGLIDAHEGVPFYVYEGWAEMTEGFPPSKRKFRRYNVRNMGVYHAWYADWVEKARAARPGRDIRLIPVAQVLSKLFTEGPLREIDPKLLYVDGDPHGTPTLYLLAAAVTYTALYGEPAPAGMDLPGEIAGEVRLNWPAITRAIAGDLQARAARAVPREVDRAMLGRGLPDPSLAMGLNGVADWATQQPFVDQMKSARVWVGHAGATWGAWDAARLEAEGFLDGDGWVKALPEGVDRIESFILTEQDEKARSLAGRYRVRWSGEGNLRIGGLARQVRMGDHEAWFDFTPGDGLVSLTITATDPEGTGDYLREIEVVREDQIALHEAGVIFNPVWVARIADLRSLRFMDWMMTNGSPVTDWEGRPRLSDYSWTRRGVPLEAMIELANMVGADPWFNMPHAADDGYSQAFAEMVLERLDPRLQVYVEYSNELWNHGFPQARWANEQARARWGEKAGDDAWMQYAGVRAAEVMRVWGGVFTGDQAERLRRVVAVHTGWLGLEEPLLEAPLWRAEGAALPPAAHFDAYAVSGYFGFELGDAEEGRLAELRDWIDESVRKAEAEGRRKGLKRKALEAEVRPVMFDQAIPRAAQAVREGSLKEVIETLWPYHAGVARRYGYELIMYEGGTHAVGHGAAQNEQLLTDFFNVFNYSGEVAALYHEALGAWRAQGGRMFNAFVDVSRPSKYGSWGALRYLEDDTARWDVLMEANALPPDGPVREDGAFLQGVYAQGDGVLEGTSEEDILIAGPGDDRLVTHGGGDWLHGGAGDDVAVLPGKRGEYGFAFQDGRLLVTRGPERFRLVSVERLEFEGEPTKVYRLELPG
ncbi:calcium-binding protein [Rhodalgimonas zhirmunskyi]|uniref:Calcium-binding protein n=1 Tax=Rhodalgimonas zhirmunskyi TaxID=2964767 RepID=A0AAJ1X691_9RHOB|nr:calcium-binding protein [Rhodoalgimonas zhirmunskyi]MDQ2093172.1 calcium-binding protein [Rhodoalgimonas zhirmunskyi]